MCVLNENITIIHTNMIHIVVVFYGAFGVFRIAEWSRNRWLPFWCISFGLFLQDYILTQSDSSYFVDGRADEALERAKELGDVMADGVYIIYYNWVEYFMDLGFEMEKVDDLYYIAVG